MRAIQAGDEVFDVGAIEVSALDFACLEVDPVYLIWVTYGVGWARYGVDFAPGAITTSDE